MLKNKLNTLKYMSALIAMSATVTAFSDDQVSSCDVTRGQSLFSKCLACHTYSQMNDHAAGPNLYGVVGREVGKVEGFKFSPALRKSGDTWSIEHLNAFLEHPMGVYPRNRMAFSGLKKPNDRADIICYMSNGVAKN